MLEHGSNLDSNPAETIEVSLAPDLLVSYGTTQFKVGRFSKIPGVVGRNRLFIGLGLGAFGLCFGGVVVNNLNQFQGTSRQGEAMVTPQANSLFPEITATPELAEATPIPVEEPENPAGDDPNKPDDRQQPPQQTLLATSTRIPPPTATRTATPTTTPEPTDTPGPTNTPRPTSTPPPSATSRPQPSNTARPSNTPIPTLTPGPTETPPPSNTPVRTATSSPTRVPSATSKPAVSSTPQRTSTAVGR